jgi:hypothetical protein
MAKSIQKCFKKLGNASTEIKLFEENDCRKIKLFEEWLST